MKGTTAAHNNYSPRGTSAEVDNFILRGIFLSLFLVASAANAAAFFLALDQPWMTKLAPILSLGGLLTFGPIEWILRIIIGIAIGWNVLTHKGHRDWIEWLALALGSMTVIAGWSALIANIVLVTSLAVWLLFQYVQFKSIEPGANPALRTIALGFYIAEFAFQCIATPISPDAPWLLLVKFFTGTLQWESVYWGLLLINIACMAGVEWLGRLYVLCLRKVR